MFRKRWYDNNGIISDLGLQNLYLNFYKNYESKYKFRAYMDSSWSYSPFFQLDVLYRLIYSKEMDSNLPLKIIEYKSNDPSGDKKENMGRPN